MSEKTPIEILKEIRDAGLDAWDSIPDPEAYLREIRGCRQAEIDVLLADIDILRAENSRLSAEVERMRGVLSQVECGGKATVVFTCPSCGEDGTSSGIRHFDDCALGRALGRPECGQ